MTSTAFCEPGRSSIGSLSAPKVTAVRSSRTSTGLVDDTLAQPAISAMSKMTGICRVCICRIIPGRELEPIMSSRLHAIILNMSYRIERHLAKYLWGVLALAWCLADPTRGASAEDIAAADLVVVHKAEHKLYLYSGSRLLGVYKVQVCLSPAGQKVREHDFRTPEGSYRLARRNTRSDYFLAIQVSYP